MKTYRCGIDYTLQDKVTGEVTRHPNNSWTLPALNREAAWFAAQSSVNLAAGSRAKIVSFSIEVTEVDNE